MKKFEVTVEHSYYTTYLVEAESVEEATNDWEFGEVQDDPSSDGPPSKVVQVVEQEQTACAALR